MNEPNNIINQKIHIKNDALKQNNVTMPVNDTIDSSIVVQPRVNNFA